MRYHVAVVGAGFTGAVLARLWAEDGKTVLVVDERDHLGGNAHDYTHPSGLLVHHYGPHIFHTNDARIVAWLSRFTTWRPYEHRVFAEVDHRWVPFPINRRTLTLLYGEAALAHGVEAYLRTVAPAIPSPRNARDQVVSRIGEALYQKFFYGYTTKQWGVPPEALRPSVTQRIPIRTNDDDRYFTDRYQLMPADGYTALFERMLAHPNITMALATPWESVEPSVTMDHLVYTGPIDRFFQYVHGRLPYRSLRFALEIIKTPQVQPLGTVNYPALEVPWTRKTEFKHLTGQQHPWTAICTEYPSAEGDPYYPVPQEDSEALAARYRRMARALHHVWIGGRLGAYQYYNMDQVVGSALHAFTQLKQQGW